MLPSVQYEKVAKYLVDTLSLAGMRIGQFFTRKRILGEGIKMVPFDVFADAIKLYCAEHNLDYAKVKTSPKCGNERTLYVQHINSGVVGLKNEEPAEILISVSKDENGKIHIIQHKNAETYLAASEPARKLSATEVKAHFKDITDMQELADAFAITSNKYWWVVDDEYDYEEGSTGHQASCAISDEWRKLMEWYENKILDIIRNEGTEIPARGRIVVLAPFMKKYGYEDRGGWWVKREG